MHTKVVRAARGARLARIRCRTLKKRLAGSFLSRLPGLAREMQCVDPLGGVRRAGRGQSAITHLETCLMICIAVGITYEEVRPLGR